MGIWAGTSVVYEYINHLDTNVDGLVGNFADNTKIGEVEGNEVDWQYIEQNID